MKRKTSATQSRKPSMTRRPAASSLASGEDPEMGPTDAQRRKLRKQQLQRLTVDDLGEVAPYKKARVTAIKRDRTDPSRVSKSEMIETILLHEGLGPTKRS